MAAKTIEKRTYILVLTNGGARKITIPAHWKLTFGNVLPYNKTSGSGGKYEPPEGWQSRIVLRIYEGQKENLRAVMNDVVSFRDSSIEVLEQTAAPVTQTAVKRTEHGKQDVAIAQTTKPVWTSPDEKLMGF